MTTIDLRSSRGQSSAVCSPASDGRLAAVDLAAAPQDLFLEVLEFKTLQIEIQAAGLNAVDATVQAFWGNAASAASCTESYGSAATLNASGFHGYLDIQALKGRYLRLVVTRNSVTAGSVTFSVAARGF